MDADQQIALLKNHISDLAIQTSTMAGQLQAIEAAFCTVVMVAGKVDGAAGLIDKELERAMSINLGTSLNTHFLDSFEATAQLIRHALSHLDDERRILSERQS